jgi:hypothetical protein
MDDSVGNGLKATQKGDLPIGTVEGILKAAPADLIEEVLAIPEWGCSVKVKSFTGMQSAAVKEKSLALKGENTEVAWAEMEISQFQMGVVEPFFTEDQVRELYATSGRGFQRVINWLDEKGNVDKEALAKARDEFRTNSDESAQV